MKYVVPILLGVAGIIVGAAATFNVFFAIVWGLQLPTRTTIYVQIALAIVQVVMLYVALLFGKRMVQRAHPFDGLVCGLGIGIFGIATQLQMMSLASAMPGQTTAQFLAWSKKADVGRMRPARSELSGRTYYHSIFHVSSGAYEVVFSAEPDVDGTIHRESIALQHAGTMETYDIRQHRKIAQSILAWAYGANVGVDFGEAKPVADFKLYRSPTHIAVYRGKLFGYQLSGIDVEVMRLKDVDEAVKLAKECSTMECGD